MLLGTLAARAKGPFTFGLVLERPDLPQAAVTANASVIHPLQLLSRSLKTAVRRAHVAIDRRSCHPCRCRLSTTSLRRPVLSALCEAQACRWAHTAGRGCSTFSCRCREARWLVTYVL